jgi:hypothetical protein
MRMRRSMLGTILGLVLGTALAAPATAAPMAFTATLTLEIAGFGTVVANGSGTGDINGNGGTATIPAGIFSISGTQTLPTGITYGGIVRGFAAGAPGQGNKSGPFAAGSNLSFQFGGATGTMGLAASFYMLNKSGKAIAAFPFANVGVGGGATTFGPIFGIAFGTVSANAYQLGMVTVPGSLFGNLTSISATGFDNRDSVGVGVLQVVSPTRFDVGGLGSLAAIATLTIVTPEPSTFVLTAAGLAAVGIVARRARREATETGDDTQEKTMHALRSTWKALLGLALGAALAAPASAAPLPFTATLKIEVGTFGTTILNGAGVGDFAGNGGTATIPAGSISVGGTQFLPPGLTLGGIVRGSALGARGQGGDFAPFSPGSNFSLQFGGATGTMGLDASFYILNKAGRDIGGFPLTKIGVGGTMTWGPLFGLYFPTIRASAYRLGVVTLAGNLLSNPVQFTATGFDNRDASGVGVLQLVSPTTVDLGPLGAGGLGTIAILSTLTIVTPEPSTFLLIGAGLAGIGFLRRREAKS